MSKNECDCCRSKSQYLDQESIIFKKGRKMKDDEAEEERYRDGQGIE